MKTARISAEEINRRFPVGAIAIYQNAIRIIRYSSDSEPPSRGDRKEIRMVSIRSLHRLAFQVGASRVEFRSLLTLTYGVDFPVSGARVKKDLNRILVWLKRKYPVEGYFWFLEFQRRGAPHIHLGLTYGPPTQGDRDKLATKWSTIASPHNWEYCPIKDASIFFPDRILYTRDSVLWQHRRRKTWEGVKSEGGLVRYMVKYSTKTRQKDVPREFRNVGRFWGTSRNIKPAEPIMLMAREAEVRRYIAQMGRDMDGYEVLPSIVFGRVAGVDDVDYFEGMYNTPY